MDIKDLSKVTKKFDAKKLKKIGIWGLIIGLILLILGVVIAVLFFGFLMNILTGVFDFGVLGQGIKDFINGFIPGFIK